MKSAFGYMKNNDRTNFKTNYTAFIYATVAEICTNYAFLCKIFFSNEAGMIRFSGLFHIKVLCIQIFHTVTTNG